jgi:tetratricopeptide (TPR) repeat protein
MSATWARAAARWLLAYLRLREDPKGALADWARVVDAERSALLRAPDDTSPAIVATLMYHLAQAYAEQGQNDLAEKTAEQARQLSPGNDPQRLEAHLQTAWSLRRRGLFRWAEAEFRRVAGAGLPVATVLANNALAEMFHDQGNHQAAAEALRGAIEVFTEKRIRQEELAGRRRHEMVARMHYFLACHAKEQGDQANHVQHLEDALRADPTEVDALIAFYRLPDATPEQRKRADRLVERAAAMMKEQILEEPDDANHYNQYAWLVGNTKGDLDEALKFSRKSLELSPNNGAYLDTLAHVHFARGELEEAVRVQTKAIEMEPHSGLLVKELEVFKAALEAKKNAGAKKP